MQQLESQLEAVLFFKGEPVSIKELATILKQSPENVRKGLMALQEGLSGRGLSLIMKDEGVLLTTARDMSALIEGLIKEDLERDLGKAGLETLTIVLYYGPLSRARIDYIRGVNSTFILRQLMVRGLIERTENPHDARGFLYKPTFELLSFLGITSCEELPNFKEVRAEIAQFEASEQEKTDAAPGTTTEPATDTAGA